MRGGQFMAGVQFDPDPGIRPAVGYFSGCAVVKVSGGVDHDAVVVLESVLDLLCEENSDAGIKHCFEDFGIRASEWIQSLHDLFLPFARGRRARPGFFVSTTRKRRSLRSFARSCADVIGNGIASSRTVHGLLARGLFVRASEQANHTGRNEQARIKAMPKRAFDQHAAPAFEPPHIASSREKRDVNNWV